MRLPRSHRACPGGVFTIIKARKICPEDIYKTKKYKKWRTLVFKRDFYTCLICGQKGGYLEAHHIYKKAIYASKTYLIENGATVCKSCHEKYVTSNEDKWIKYFQDTIKNKENRCN